MRNQKIESVKELIGNGKIEEAIDHLLTIKVGFVNQIRIQILKFRLSSLNHENNKGVLSNEENLIKLQVQH